MTVADILDGGFAIVKARPRRILGLTAAFVVPTQLAVALLQRDALEDTSLVEFFSADPTVTNEPVTGGELAAQYVALADRDHRPGHRAGVHRRRHRPPRRAVGHGARRPRRRDGRGHRSAVVAAARLVRRREAGRGGQRASAATSACCS